MWTSTTGSPSLPERWTLKSLTPYNIKWSQKYSSTMNYIPKDEFCERCKCNFIGPPTEFSDLNKDKGGIDEVTNRVFFP